MFKIKTYNAISSKGLERFGRDKYQVGKDIESPDAYLLRSHKLHGEPVPDSLLAVARAGAGVNNIPIADYGKRGIVVFNTPGANANAVKELVLAGMLLSVRGILPGIAYAQSLADMGDSAAMHALLEKEKSRFAGGELRGKTLGIVGLGAIGSLVADIALAMGMNVLGFDPALSIDAAWRLSNAVQRMENLPSLLGRSDYISLHVPALDATRHMINADTLQHVREGAVLLNFARESIVDPEAVQQALDSGRLGRYVCDFPEPGLVTHPRVIAMPHIGASTEESEENCAVMAADQVIDFLENGHISNSVNYPAIRMDRTPGATRVTFANDNVAGVLGQVLSVLADAKVNVLDMSNRSRDALAYNIIDVASAPDNAVIDAIRAVNGVISVRVV
ncbi:3-phosphoglycerate dehydrogenase family protein [Ottowia sp.]|uniref:3-phosphoglycerate dehydrogenase family protein n=1 Tax=Ottowia sp. TaxID=1898956 RepID=UPI002C8405CC|nr:3-phosphoglycerate dehydrogenase family protein [Ottowia sp.]HRN77148.1 3-phosphoglycerate dehydrogenase family protein [Ottowia sp.]HRQ02280.1 3-phosphoglycerate dehydrogenase family protein [Ottowia sp.]